MNPLIQNFSWENIFKLLSRRLTIENFDFFVRGPQCLYKMNPNLQENWFAGELFFNTPARLIYFKGKFDV